MQDAHAMHFQPIRAAPDAAGNLYLRLVNVSERGAGSRRNIFYLEPAAGEGKR